MDVRPAAVTAGAAIALGLLAFASPAQAGDGDQLSDDVVVIPSVAEQGESVEVDTDACGLDTFAVASSRAFKNSISLEPVDQEFVLAGVGQIDKKAKVGQHKVTVECAEGTRVTGTVRVIPRGGPDTGFGGMADGVAATDADAADADAADADAADPAESGGPGGSGGVPASQYQVLAGLTAAGALTAAGVVVRRIRRRSAR